MNKTLSLIIGTFFLSAGSIFADNIHGQGDAANAPPNVVSTTLTPRASMYLQLGERNAVKIPFKYTDAGVPTPIHWGMDTAWDDEGNVRRGVNFIGLDNLTYGRFSFQVMDPVDANGNLSQRQQQYLRSRLNHISLSRPTGLLLNSDPIDINVDVFLHHPEEWYKVIKATVKYAQDYGVNVVAIAPFNEPDVTDSNQGTKDDFKAVAKLIREDPFFDGIRICAGNTCNNDGAWEWYNHMKPYVDEGNTHQLAGSFDNYAEFYSKVKADGNVGTNDELHNVMEGIVGVQYGMENGIWWGTVGPSRGDFCLATSEGGARLGYGENRAAWTAAAVYRLPNGVVKAFAGASERQAFPCSYEYVSTDKPVYFDGNGPYFSYPIMLPAGYRYGDKYQMSAERTVQIHQGEDVPLCPLTSDKEYIIVNKKTKKLLTIQGGSTSNSAAVVQYENKNYAYQKWTLEALKDNGGDLTGFYVHSVRNMSMNLETGGFQVNVGGTVSVYPVTKLENQRWTFEYAGDGYYRIRNYQSGLYLEIPNGSTTNNVAVKICSEADEDQQLWRILPADATYETTPPAKPTGLTATPKNHSIALRWDANTQDRDFYGFLVLRGEKRAESATEFDVIGRNIMVPCFVDNSCREGVTYEYAVMSVDYSQNRSEKSDAVSASTSGEQGLVARYEFEQSATDLSENLLDGVVAEARGFSNVNGYHRSGRAALMLDGTSNYMAIPAMTTCLPHSTITTWVYNPGNIPEGSRLFSFGADADHEASLSLNQGGKMRLTLKNGATSQTLEASQPQQGWHHLALTIGSGRIALYVDGAEIAASEHVDVRLSDLRPVRNFVGCGQTADIPLMNGYVDDLRIYNYVLSQDEIAQLLNQAEPAEGSAWAPPVVPGKDLARITALENVYLYNVDADAFVTYGMSWNTQTVSQRLPKGDKSVANRFRIGVSKDTAGKVFLSFRDKSSSCIGCLPDAANVWSDRSRTESAFTYQGIDSPMGKLYTLKSDSQDALLDVTYAYGGPLTTRNGRNFIHWAFIPVKDISNGNYALYKERKRLYNVYQAIVDAEKETEFANELQKAHQAYVAADATVGTIRTATRNLILAAAPYVDAELDVSALFTNADMLGNNTTADWTETSTTIKEGDIEVLHQPITLEQTQTDIPNGVYEVVFHGFYRNDATGKVPTVTAQAQGTVKGNIPTRDKIIENEVLMNAEETAAGAAQTLASDAAQTRLTDIIVDDSQMTLSATVTSEAQWFNFQGFDITYKRPFVRVEVPASGYTTFYYSDQSFLLPEGMEAYTCIQKNGKITVNRSFTEAGTVLPAGQALVLKATPGVYDMMPTTKKKTVDSINQLRGTDADELTHGGSYYYTLTENEEGETGFNWSATGGATFVNPAHKAYFAFKGDTSPADFYPIESVTSVSANKAAVPFADGIYNLAGQRITTPQRGVYLIKSRSTDGSTTVRKVLK